MPLPDVGEALFRIDASDFTEEAVWHEYWPQQMRRTVRFSEALTALGDVDAYLEIGASPTLTSLCRNIASDSLWLFSQGPSVPAWKQISLTLARLYVSGCSVDFSGGIFARSVRADIPLYPFKETVHRLSPLQERAAEVSFDMPDMEAVSDVSKESLGRVMKMQVSSLKRLFDSQLETLNKLTARESEFHE